MVPLYTQDVSNTNMSGVKPNSVGVITRRRPSPLIMDVFNCVPGKDYMSSTLFIKTNERIGILSNDLIMIY